LVWRLVPRNVKRSVAADSAQENGGRSAQCVRAIALEARFQYTHKPASYRIFVRRDRMLQAHKPSIREIGRFQMANSDVSTLGPGAATLDDVKKHWGWLLALGILFVLLGTVGLGMSVALTAVSVIVFGVLLLIGGGAQLVEAFRHKSWKSTLWHILIALVYLAAGAMTIRNPFGASVALKLILAVALLAAGLFRIFIAFQLRPAAGWWWPLVAGIGSLVLGAMIYAQWPVSGLWVIGLFVAIEMIMNGWSYVVIALAARRA
jgi:uncharacterized membrane protein HdeD (DUF308 family)